LSKEKSKHLELEKINKNIEELRDILNEICCTITEDEKDKERLKVSEALDELIVQYMKEINK
jgi:two-component system, cell cycle response regulator